MKDNLNFVKLFDLNVPVMEHFDYYIDQLSKSQKYKDIKYFLSLYRNMELDIDDVNKFRKNKSDEIIAFIKSTNSYIEMCYDKNLIDYPTVKNIEYLEGVKYLSIDLRNANWASLKHYDPPHINELGKDYLDFLDKFNLPKVFIFSKYLRQFIFGNVDPRRIIKVQRNLIQNVVRQYQNFLQLEGVRNDEAIFSFKKFDDISTIYKEIDSQKYKTKIFSINKVENFRIDNIYSVNGDLTSREMVGVDGTQFYLKLKEYITGETIDERDLYFRNNHKLAKWVL